MRHRHLIVEKIAFRRDRTAVALRKINFYSNNIM